MVEGDHVWMWFLGEGAIAGEVTQCEVAFDLDVQILTGQRSHIERYSQKVPARVLGTRQYSL